MRSASFVGTPLNYGWPLPLTSASKRARQTPPAIELKTTTGAYAMIAKKKRLPYIYEPVGYDDFEIPPENKDGVRWLISTCYFYEVAVWRGDDEDRWAYLSAGLLGKVVGRNIKPIRDAAVRAGLIECDNHYIVGSKPMGYRLGASLDGAQWRRWSGDGQMFLNRYKKFKAHWNTTKDLDDLGLYMRRWIMKAKFGAGLKAVLAGMPDGKKRDLALRQVELIKAGIIKTKYCDFGRFHSNMTRMCSEIRALLEIDGEPLVEIDIVSSQVLFLADLLKSNGLEYSPSSHSFPSSSSLSYPSLPYDRSIHDEFFVDLEGGRTYERFMRHFDYPSRSETKDEFFGVIYGGMRRTKLLAQVWPKAAAVLQRIKRANPFGWIPQEMQRRESHRILRGAVDHLRLNHPEIPIITVHDSIMTTQRHVETVKAALLDAFSDFPFTPRLRIKEAA
ncbi:hypothetical protein [Paludisphaera mucosa]|uniref:DNA-directed DNA polymerase family A palm domain-containing protein n=1 Tax=Paludisphaera mucosa TaxID=3030827 RepID=A0ABT6F4Z8_9BACT|nr:hypothetical protein [Paludisphaera mucosa]MDG3002576.1 hypothetical protein [Paludisphaera mucosa]